MGLFLDVTHQVFKIVLLFYSAKLIHDIFELTIQFPGRLRVGDVEIVGVEQGVCIVLIIYFW